MAYRFEGREKLLSFGKYPTVSLRDARARRDEAKSLLDKGADPSAVKKQQKQERGYNRDWIERQLAHSERNGVRAAYNYAEYLPERRRMMQEWADYLDELKRAAK